MAVVTLHWLCASQQEQGDLYSMRGGLAAFSYSRYHIQRMAEIWFYLLGFSSESTHLRRAKKGTVAALSTRGREALSFLRLEKP